MKRWRCLICDYIYEEENGMPEHGIPPGTLWKDIPDDWECPDCEAKKHDFEEIK